MSALPVVVADHSHVRRRQARLALSAHGEFEVVGEARTGPEAVALVARLRPSALLLALDLPGGGLAAVEQIMAGHPTPIVVCPPDEERAGAAALAAGAVDVLVRPEADDADGGQAEAMRGRMRVAVRARVITHPRDRLRRVAPPPRVRQEVAPAPTDPTPCRRLVALGASTGGPPALLTVLSALPADLEQAVVVVQHMAASFVPGLVAWLDSLVAVRVVVGQSGRRLAPGTVTVAPGGSNLLVQDDRLRVLCTAPAPGQFHVPGIDATFGSVADALGPEAVGVVLTGMGRDGAAGLRAMRERGAATIAQDEATSAVYGMPAAAHAVGAVGSQLPVGEIGPALLGLLGRAPCGSS